MSRSGESPARAKGGGARRARRGGARRSGRSWSPDAERKMGLMLIEKPPGYKAGPGRGIKGGAVGEPPFPTNEDLGLTKKESARAQMLFNPLRFEPAVDVAFTKEDLSLEFEKRNLSIFHHGIYSPLADTKKSHDFGLCDKVFFHPGAYSNRDGRENKEKGLTIWTKKFINGQ